MLLLDPLPSINRVFSLVVQEERQRVVGNQYNLNASANGMVFALKGDQPRSQHNARTSQKFSKGRLFCTTCNAPGHTVDTCYKIHGYPPGYKPRNKNFHKKPDAHVNQVSAQSSSSEASENVDIPNSKLFQALDKSQMEQLMTMFVQHLSDFDTKQGTKVGVSNSFASGTYLSTSISTMLHSSYCWIVDFGASRQIF